MRRKRKKFLKKYLIYVGVLIGIMLIFLTAVFFILKDYEKNIPVNYISYYLENISKDDIEKYFKTDNNYEDKNEQIKNVKNFLKNKEYKVKRKSEFVYSIFKDKNELMTISLKSNKTIKRLGLLTYNELEVDTVKTTDSNYIYAYTLLIPHNFKVIINDSEINDNDLSEETKITGLESLYDYVEMPIIKKYVIDNLTKKPNIEILDSENNKVNVNLDNEIIDLSNNFKKYDSLEEANIDAKVLEFAENWSLFLTKDLTGSYYGLNTISKYFIENSEMAKKAYDWAHSVDITFTSRHTLKNPTFTNESVKNVIVYNENAFSCDVYLEKNMIVNRSDKVDVLHNKINYVKVNGEWKVVSMQAVVEE